MPAFLLGIYVYIYAYCTILYSFQTDLGAPLSKNNSVLGILVKLPEDSKSFAFFFDILKSFNEINHLINDRVLLYRKSLPRKKARFDYITSRDPRGRTGTIEAPKKRKHGTLYKKS